MVAGCISLFGYAVLSAEGPGPKQRLGPHLLAGLVTKGNPANRPTQNIQDTVSQIGRPWRGKRSDEQLD